MSWGRVRSSVPMVALAALLLGGALAGCSRSDDASKDHKIDLTPLPVEVERWHLGHLSVAHGTPRSRIVDADGREVILRGANLNALGDYYQADPAHVPTKPPTRADWERMAAHGFSVVRLIVSWSKFEPQRGAFDETYLQTVRKAIADAEAHGMYTVVDFHQDAWGKYIASPKGTRCTKGLVPAIGWDGAPKWATITDGADTCRPEGYREGAAAVQAAFKSFYANRDGIRDAYVKTVAKVAGALAGTSGYAGIDLMNEPNKVLPDADSTAAYTELTADLVTAIRRAEADAHEPPALVFLEPVVLFPLGGTMPDPGQPDDPNIVFAPHNYGEVITKILTTEATFGVSATTANDRGWPLWIGEYGIFDTSKASIDILTRFAKAEDEHLAGSAEWQWRQRCGDPHSVGSVGGTSGPEQVHLNITSCPADTSKPNEAFLSIVGRPFARYAPGQLTKVTSDAATGTLHVEGTATAKERSQPLMAWFPGDVRPTAHPVGLTAPKFLQVDGGWYVTYLASAADYRLDLVRK